MIKSPIKWAGGKSWLIDIINNDYLSLNTTNFIEVCAGSAVVSLNSPCENIIANDICNALIIFHDEVKNGLKINENYDLSEYEFYNIRTRFNEIKDIVSHTSSYNNRVELATLFYYLNRYGFNGLYRENSKGFFNVPCGKKKKTYELNANLDAYSKIIFTCSDYKTLNIPSDSLLYIDPPYDTPFTKYSKNDFTWEDQIDIIQWAVSTKEPFIISNQATDRIIDLYASLNLNINYLMAPRRISANGDRSKAREVYAKNF